MLIRIKNLGVLRQAEFSLGDLTIICGDNNTGKTYATYALFGFLSFWREAFSIDVSENAIDQLLSEGTLSIDIGQYVDKAEQILSDGCRQYSKQLPMVFAAQERHFKGAGFEVILDTGDIRTGGKFNRTMGAPKADLFSMSKGEDSEELVITLLVEKENLRIPRDVITITIGHALKEVIFRHLFPNPFIACAERTGVAIFRKELNFPRNRMLEEISQADKNINPMDLLFKIYEDYALPVKINVEFTRNLETISKRDSFIARKYPDVLAEFVDIAGGEYAFKNDELYYMPKGTRVRLSMDESSSATRSLLDIGFYLRHVATPGDLLMVDEPELNLHPKNQRRVARLLARLVNLGIKVFITTHSDYIIKELNTLIMLNHEKLHLRQIAENEGYKKEELLSSDKVKVYIAEEASVKLEGAQRSRRCPTLIPADIDPELGIEARSFDTTIELMNRIQEEIVWGGE